MNRLLSRLRALVILAGFCAACGTEPELAEKAEAPLRDAQDFYSGPPFEVQAAYQCGGAWVLRTSLKQVKVGISFADSAKWFTGADDSRATVGLDCSNSADGPDFYMAKTGSILYNVASKRCLAYSHLANDPGGWFYGGLVTIPAAGLQVTKRSGPGQPETVTINFTPAAGVYGQPGFCASPTGTGYVYLP